MFVFSCVVWITDQEHIKDQEDEEETAEEDWEERHAGSAAEVTEAQCESQRAQCESQRAQKW